MLGRTTHAANNHAVVVENGSGKQITKIIRGAMPAEHRAKRRPSPDRDPAQPLGHRAVLPPPIGRDGIVLPPPLKAPKVGSVAPARAGSAKAFEREQLRGRVDDIASSLSVSAGRPSASEGLAALRLRVGIKISSPATD